MFCYTFKQPHIKNMCGAWRRRCEESRKRNGGWKKLFELIEEAFETLWESIKVFKGKNERVRKSCEHLWSWKNLENLLVVAQYI
jgi:hypothetical protein